MFKIKLNGLNLINATKKKRIFRPYKIKIENSFVWLCTKKKQKQKEDCHVNNFMHQKAGGTYLTWSALPIILQCVWQLL